MSRTMTVTKPMTAIKGTEETSNDTKFDNDIIRVPARIIYSMDLQIRGVERSIAKKQQQLADLKAARAKMVKDRD